MRMIIVKVINNNLVISDNDDKQDVILMGKGLGYQKKIGDVVDESTIEKRFVSGETANTNKLVTLLAEIPHEQIAVATEIISFAKVSLGKTLSDSIFITLTDHINHAIERHQNGLALKNALLWEIKRFYNHEFLIGKEAVNIIHQRLNITLNEDEAGFIALHIVNAELDLDRVSQVSEMTEVIQNILNIVKYYYKIELDEYSLNYERFVTHLKFFVQRLMSGVSLEDENDQFITILKDKYTEAYSCALKIRDYILKNFNRDLTENEMIYLTIHIHRVTTQ